MSQLYAPPGVAIFEWQPNAEQFPAVPEAKYVLWIDDHVGTGGVVPELEPVVDPLAPLELELLLLAPELLDALLDPLDEPLACAPLEADDDPLDAGAPAGASPLSSGSVALVEVPFDGGGDVPVPP